MRRNHVENALAFAMAGIALIMFGQLLRLVVILCDSLS
jgi:hypothetical protein